MKIRNKIFLLLMFLIIISSACAVNAQEIDNSTDDLSLDDNDLILSNANDEEILNSECHDNQTTLKSTSESPELDTEDITSVSDAEDDLMSSQDVLYISPKGNDNNLGTRDSPMATLSHAIEITETGNIILLEGIHNASGLNTTKTLKITGEGDVTIDAHSSNRILYIYEGGDVILSNVKMINGYSNENGALLGNVGNLTLINTTLSNSISNSNGGAIYNIGTLTIINSTIKNNTATLGGAIYSGSNTKMDISVKIINTNLVDNIARGNANNKGGGAIYAQASSEKLIIKNATFKNNNAGKYGGGALYAMQLDNIEIHDSKFIKNSAESDENYGGGAIAIIGGNYQREGTATITNTLFEDNHADLSGGAIFIKGTTLDISNSVLVNSVDDNGIVIHSEPTVNSVNSKITANYNWWGSNDNPRDLITKVTTVTLTRWVILTIENDTEIAEGNNVNITVSLTDYTTGSENATLPKPLTIPREVSVKTLFEEIKGVLNNGKYILSYCVPPQLELFSVTVDGHTVVLYGDLKTYMKFDDVAGEKGSQVNITAQILTSDSKVINDGHINFYVDSIFIGYADVLNNNATLTYLIKEDKGVYNLTAEYVNGSGSSDVLNITKVLNVTGVINTVLETPQISIDCENITQGDIENIKITLPGDAKGNVTVKIDGVIVNVTNITNGTANITISSLKAGNYSIEIAYSGDEKYTPINKTAIVSVDEKYTPINKTEIVSEDKKISRISSKDVTATYNDNKYLTVTLTDSQSNPIGNATVTVMLKSSKTYITDEKGQIKIKIGNLVPKTYSATVTFAGDDSYSKSNVTVKVTVKKAASKLTAKAKTFKSNVKTKKYTVVLKDNNGNPIKKAKVSLKVKGKTYSATTTRKGKATFNLKKLTKKGKHWATIKFKETEYYKKITKKVKIKVK